MTQHGARIQIRPLPKFQAPDPLPPEVLSLLRQKLDIVERASRLEELERRLHIDLLFENDRHSPDYGKPIACVRRR